MENNIFTFNYQLVNATTSEMIHMGTVTLGLNSKELVSILSCAQHNMKKFGITFFVKPLSRTCVFKNVSYPSGPH